MKYLYTDYHGNRPCLPFPAYRHLLTSTPKKPTGRRLSPRAAKVTSLSAAIALVAVLGILRVWLGGAEEKSPSAIEHLYESAVYYPSDNQGTTSEQPPASFSF